MNILRRTALAVSVIVLSSAFPQIAVAYPSPVAVPAVTVPGPLPVDDFVILEKPRRDVQSEYTYVDQPLAGSIKTTLVTVKLADKSVDQTNAAVPMGAAQASLNAASTYWAAQTSGRVSMPLINAATAVSSAARSTQTPNEIVDIVSRELGWTQTPYTALVMYIPGAYLTNGAAGMVFSNGSVGGRIIMPENGRLSTPVLTHEFGHTLGLDHANSLQCGSGISDVGPGQYSGFADPTCGIKIYGDNLDVMGISHYDYMPVIGAPLWEMGRFGNGNEIADAGTVTTTKSLTLKPWAGTGADRAAKFTDPKSGEVYYLELRAPVGYDAGKATGGNRGVKISQQGSGNSSILLPPSTLPISGNYSSTQAWQAGTTFKTHTGTRVTIDSVSDSAAVVTLRPPGAPAVGYAESVAINRSGDKASLDVRGWAYDGAKPAESSQVHIYVTTPGGIRTGYPVTANQPRSDVNAIMQVAGDHGFAKSFDLTTAGTYDVCVYALGSVETADLGCRTLNLEGSAPPIGYLDSVAVALSNGSPVLRAEGWTFDPGSPAASIPVHLYVTDPAGKTTSQPFTADRPKADVNAIMGVPGNHGYRADVPITLSGQYTACAYGLAVSQFNLGNSLLGCKSISAQPTAAPVGYVDTTSVNSASTAASITVKGWSLDPGTPSASIPVHVYVTAPDGTTTSTAHMADQVRADVNSVMGTKGNHGYQATIPISRAGSYRVCVYGLAVSALPLGNTLLGCQVTTAKATAAPAGYLDSVKILAGAQGANLTAKGWTLDPALPSASIPVHLYVTYPDGTTKATAYLADNSRPDVNTIIQVVGDHGYEEAIPVTQRGTYTVCAWGLGVAGLSEGNTHLGCRQATY
ncbi:hypothetical protein NG701_07840 [Pseudarthrobacter sp. HLT3-5]|uniref:hypothetical protein n=1 Tax=Pseudarthrobacter cellobiosi TaxID=2953654 RepID=UPI00208E86D4|nr:hypothetical protein [Pseudarthrobacter sp. HLT3-5]MCO4274340.1 hypothetical protein [Pseudarthrobacter sp. HLT3-5]